MTSERLSITVPVNCAQTIRQMAKRHNRSLSAEVSEALKDYVSGVVTLENVDKGYNMKLESEKQALQQQVDVDKTYIMKLEFEKHALLQRIDDKDEIVKSKNETIGALGVALGISPEGLLERAKMATSEREGT